jgi:hypothetical protein
MLIYISSLKRGVSARSQIVEDGPAEEVAKV